MNPSSGVRVIQEQAGNGWIHFHESTIRQTGLRPCSRLTRNRALEALAITDRPSLHRDDDFALVRACAKMTKGFPCFAQRIKAIDHGNELSGFKTFV